MQLQSTAATFFNASKCHIQFIMIFLALLLYACHTDASSIVYVNVLSGNNENCSIGSGAESPCRTIEYAYTLLQGQTEAIFKLETDVELNQQLIFQTVKVALQSSLNSETRRINCNGYGGFIITNCSSFILSHVEFHGCRTQDNTTQDDATIIITSSTEINITHAYIFNSSTSAIMLNDSYGNITLNNLVLDSNKGESCPPKAGGLSIVTSSTKSSRYNIKNCTFHNNLNNQRTCNCTPSSHKNCSKPSTIRYKSLDGGGMSIIILGKCSHNTIDIKSCNFVGNTGYWGGGLNLFFYKAEQNNITISDCIFTNNKAIEDGGGISLIHATSSTTNLVTFRNVNFTSNLASHGGATVIQVSKNNTVKFESCTWENNVANYLSPAIDIARYPKSTLDGYFSTLCFQDVNFTNNSLQIPGKSNTHHSNDGVFLTTEVNVNFSGQITFVNNYFSALKAVSSTLMFHSNSVSTFVNNRGINGAAIALYGFSKLSIDNDNKFSFINNTASSSGGGIYYNGIDQHDFFGGTKCFIDVSSKSPRNNVTFHFDGNEALQGRWIFADSFISCQCNIKGKLNKPVLLKNVINCIGEFKPKPLQTQSNLITSSGKYFILGPLKYSAIPGETVPIRVIVKDDFGLSLHPLLKLDILDKSSSNITLAENYTLIPQVHPKGPPRERAKIQVSCPGIRNINFVFDLSLEQCPPGFVYNTTSKTCICGHDKYLAIVHCDNSSFQAIMDKNYWAGYIHKDLYFAPCVFPVCSEKRQHKLPKRPDELNKYICNQTNRSGMMCGQCIPNHTVHYHSPTKFCKPTKNCNIGPLIYICSEIIPVIILFFIVAMCDLSFTSGKVVGLIFLVQNLGGVNLSVSNKYTEFSRLIYGIFNMELLTSEYLSFCLWESMDIQDIIAVKYVTILFAFALVFTQILLLKTNRCVYLFAFKRKISRNYSFIHGLSAFLVICYYQCTKTSFQLLQFTRPVSMNGTQAGMYTYYGGQPYFKGKHLYYSIIALINLIMVTLLAPCILLFHPLLLNLLSFCHLSEHRITLKIYQLLHVQKLMPFIDCFQSCYKDGCRFFAGLYFTYRIALILCVILSQTYNDCLLYTQFLLLLILIIHSISSPYKKSLHNSLDSMTFSVLTIINFLSILVEKKTPLGKKTKDTLNVFQVLLIYLPIVGCMIAIIRKVFKKLRNRNTSYTNLIDTDTADRQEEEEKVTCSHRSQEYSQHSTLRNYSK